MTQSRHWICGLVFVGLLTACETNSSADPATPTVAPPAPHMASRAVMARSCIHRTSGPATEAFSLLTAVGAAIIPKAIDAGVGALATAVRKAGEAEARDVLSGSAAAEALNLSADGRAIVLDGGFRCLIVAKGDVNAGDNAFTRPEWGVAPDLAKQQALRKLTGINTDPVIYYEAETQLSGEGNSFRLLSRHLEYFGDPKGYRDSADLAITVTLSSPGGSDGRTAVGLATLVFDDVAPGTVLDAADLAGHYSAWIPLPAVPGDLSQKAQAIAALRQQFAAREAEIAALDAMTDADYDARQTATEALRRIAAEETSSLVAAENAADRLQDASKDKDNQLARAKTRLAREQRKVDLNHDLATNTRTRTEEIARLQNLNLALDARINALYPKSPMGAVNVDVTVRETVDANGFLLAVADVLDASKTEVGDALKAKVDPGTRARLEAEAETAAARATADAFTRQEAALVADQLVEKTALQLSLMSEETDPVGYIDKLHALRNAKRAANEKRRLAGLPQIHDPNQP